MAERPTRDYWQAFRDHAARLLPSGTFGRLHRLARATAGGRAQRKANPEAAPGDPADPSVAGEPADAQRRAQRASEDATSDPSQPSVGGDAGLPYPPVRKAYQGNGLFLLARLDPEDAKALAVPGGEDPADLHLTLCDLGDVDDLPADAAEKARSVLATCCADQSPIACSVNGNGTFYGPDGDHLWASVDAPALPAFRQRLVEALQAAGLPESGHHGYTPHVTLADQPTGAHSGWLRSPVRAMTLRHVTVAAAGKEHATVPFGGGSPAQKDAPSSAQVHVPGVSGMVDPRFRAGMPGPGGVIPGAAGGRHRRTGLSVAYALRKDAGKGGSAVEVVVKRAYDAPGHDGIRVLVDRRWPRGVSEKWARIALVHKALAPSEALETWAAANPWDRQGFIDRYAAELAQRPEARVAVEKLADLASRTRVTLVTAATDREFNHAQILKAALEGDPGPDASLDEPDDEPDDDEFEKAVKKAKWTTAYINSLPDSSFAYVAPGGRKDDEGRTFPRSLRHLPFQDHDGDDDEAHIRAALTQLPKADIPPAAKAQARRRIEAAARRRGIEVQKDDDKPPHVGLSDEVKRHFIEMAKKDPPIHIAAAMRRLSEWAASGHYPQGLDHADLRWMHTQYAKILRHRNPDSTAGSTAFPTEKAYGEAVEKCHSLTATLGRIREIIATGKAATTKVQKADTSRRVQIVKADTERRLVYGVVMEPNEVDTQGDFMRPEEIEKAAHRFMKNGHKVGLQHNGVTKDADVVENFIAPQDLVYTAPDGSRHHVKKGSWVQVTHIPDDDLWADVQDGKYTGYSVGGVGERVAA